MSRTPRRIPNPGQKAEGLIYVPGHKDPVPYRTDLVGPDGCAIHLWMGKRDQDGSLRAATMRVAHYHRDIVQATYSTGEPDEYWEPKQNMRMD
jgi:hypothetical protein